jgi:hypothetical protein
MTEQTYERRWSKGRCRVKGPYDVAFFDGGTPVPGHETLQDGSPNEKKNSDLVSELQKADEASRIVEQHIQENPDSESIKDARYFFPNGGVSAARAGNFRSSGGVGRKSADSVLSSGLGRRQFGEFSTN